MRRGPRRRGAGEVDGGVFRSPSGRRASRDGRGSTSLVSAEASEERRGRTRSARTNRRRPRGPAQGRRVCSVRSDCVSGAEEPRLARLCGLVHPHARTHAHNHAPASEALTPCSRTPSRSRALLTRHGGLRGRLRRLRSRGLALREIGLLLGRPHDEERAVREAHEYGADEHLVPELRVLPARGAERAPRAGDRL